jgi:hypothetical protein
MDQVLMQRASDGGTCLPMIETVTAPAGTASG